MPSPSRWIIIAPIVIGMAMGLLVRRPKITNACGKRPSITPPPYVFFIVWPILYFLMGIVYYQYLKKSGLAVSSPFSLFLIGFFILLNMWYVIFGNVCAPVMGFVSIFLIALLAYYVVYQLWKKKVPYWYLLIALLAWMTFATYLTYLSVP
jgi:tryptophan-rich sensory protein